MDDQRQLKAATQSAVSEFQAQAIGRRKLMPFNPFPLKEFVLLMQLLQRVGCKRESTNQKHSFVSTLLLQSMREKLQFKQDIPWHLAGR